MLDGITPQSTLLMPVVNGAKKAPPGDSVAGLSWLKLTEKYPHAKRHAAPGQWWGRLGTG